MKPNTNPSPHSPSKETDLNTQTAAKKTMAMMLPRQVKPGVIGMSSEPNKSSAQQPSNHTKAAKPAPAPPQIQQPSMSTRLDMMKPVAPSSWKEGLQPPPKDTRFQTKVCLDMKMIAYI